MKGKKIKKEVIEICDIKKEAENIHV